MKPTLERLTEQFTRLIGPEAFAKAKAAQAAAATAAAEAAKAAAAKAEAAKAAAAAAAATPKPAAPVPASSPVPVPAATPAAAMKAAAPAPRPATPATAAPAAPRPTAAAAPALPLPPPLPVEQVSHAAKGYNFDAIVAPAQVVPAAELLDAHGFGLDAVTGVDWIAQNEMEVVYDFFHPVENLRVVVRTRVPRTTPEVPTISKVFPGANWHEREAHDFFGLTFAGHPNLKPFLLPEDANFHPLRKDYQP
jgi:NADH-quinone oxidoreductase subunit C